MARETAPQRTSDKVVSRRILVNIKRDMTSVVPRVIWQHEKPLLEELFGEGNVTEVDASTVDEGYEGTPRPDLLPYNKTMDKVAKPSTTLGIGHVFIGSADGEFQRLADVYGKHPSQDVLLVDMIYGRFQTGNFSRLMGQPELADLPDTQLRGLVLDYGYAPEPHKDAGPDEKNAAWAMRKALMVADKAALVKIAESVGVEIG
jgi:hypothetical protein